MKKWKQKINNKNKKWKIRQQIRRVKNELVQVEKEVINNENVQ